MSITPTAGHATRQMSGRWFKVAPTRSPPLLPPLMTRRSGEV